MHRHQQGQTLVETVVAIFIMVMGIVASLGLAIYSLNASTGITKQLIAVGLAREGMEVIKNMRDNNWLKDPASTICYNYETGASNTRCYDAWLNAGAIGGHNFRLLSGNDVKAFSLSFNPTSTVSNWTLIQRGTNENSSVPAASLFSMDYDSTAAAGLYRPAVNQAAPTSEYYRKVTVESKSNVAPYNANGTNYSLLIVTSQVWWRDRRCPVRTNAPNRNLSNDTRCLVTLQMYLTNWKTF